MAAKKTTKKTAAKKASKKSPGKKSTTKKSAAKKSPSKKASEAGEAAPAKKTAKKAGKAKVSSLDVNMGHVFALRPRMTTSFKPGDFSTAKYRLQEEAFSTIHEAARAVAEKALELTHEAGSTSRRGRF